ncbi:MAG: hypothetical protein NTZ59_08040 [Bacteroidetes bacterium]|nr:hypothetical protein [Bacteroidota bacterium]
MLSTLKKILSTHKNYVLLAAIVLFIISVFIQENKTNNYNEKQVQQNIQQYITAQENDFNTLCSSNTFIEDIKKSNPTVNKNYGIGLYEWEEESYELIAWNNLNFIDTVATHYAIDTSYLIENTLGYFECIIKHIHTSNTTYLAYAILPIHYSFSTTQEYRSPIKEYFNYYTIDTSNKSKLTINTANHRLLFHITKNQSVINVPYSYTTIITRLLGILLLCFYIHLTAIRFVKNTSFKKGFIFLVTVLGLLRCITYFFKIPFVFSKLTLFDPTIFASNVLHPSLGDLLINLLLLFWIVSFIENKEATNNTSKNKWRALLQLAIIVAVSFLFIDLIKSLVIDSKIPFDVENFFNLNEFTAVAFATICLIIINYVKISIALYQAVIHQKMSLGIQVIVVFIVGIAGIVTESYFYKYNILFPVIILCWLIVFVSFLFLFEAKRFFFHQKNSILSLYWILFFTASTAAIIVFFEEKLEVEQRQQLAEKIYLSKQSNADFSLTEAQSSEYSFAIYQNGKLKENTGTHLFYRHQSPYNIGFSIEENNGESKLTYQVNEDAAVVLIKKMQHSLNFLTLFAYLFFAFVIVVFLLFFVLKIAVAKIFIKCSIFYYCRFCFYLFLYPKI